MFKLSISPSCLYFTQKDLNTEKIIISSLIPTERGSLLWTHIQKSLMETDSHWIWYLVINAIYCIDFLEEFYTIK